MLNNARIRSQSICCNCNLKQVGLAFKTWAIDHTNSFPMEISTNIGGTRECTATGEVFRHFQVMSNELSTPKVLICPRDSRRFASAFGTSFVNSNMSYFIGIDAKDTEPQAFLSGDRNITNGTRLRNGILELSTNYLSGWTHDLHNRSGNVGLADGSVQQLNTLRLREAVSWTGTNRLAIP